MVSVLDFRRLPKYIHGKRKAVEMELGRWKMVRDFHYEFSLLYFMFYVIIFLSHLNILPVEKKRENSECAHV